MSSLDLFFSSNSSLYFLAPTGPKLAIAIICGGKIKVK